MDSFNFKEVLIYPKDDIKATHKFDSNSKKNWLWWKTRIRCSSTTTNKEHTFASDDAEAPSARLTPHVIDKVEIYCPLDRMTHPRSIADKQYKCKTILYSDGRIEICDLANEIWQHASYLEAMS